jgi:hypothetical protein
MPPRSKKDTLTIDLPTIPTGTSEKIKKYVTGSETLSSKGKKPKVFRFSFKNQRAVRKVLTIASQAAFKRGEGNPTFNYVTKAGRQVSLPINLFKGKEQISGPACLQRVLLDGRVYLFFGDVHFSQQGECADPELSVSIEKIIEKFVKNDSKTMPSIDFFTEIDFEKDVSMVPSDANKDFPLFRWMGLKGREGTCFLAQDRYAEEFTRSCGLNFRYHGSDIRSQVDVSRIQSVQGVEDLSERNVEKVLQVIAATKKMVQAISEAIGSAYPVKEESEETVQKLQEKILIQYRQDMDFRNELQENFLEVLRLQPEFKTAFSTGTARLSPVSKLDSRILKQIKKTSPEKVKDIFNYLLLTFILTIQRSGLYEVRFEAKWKQILENPFAAAGVPPSITFEQLRTSELVRNSHNFKNYSRMLKNEERMLQAEKLRTLTLWIAMTKQFGQRSILLNERSFIMDLYTLLRMERKYTAKRKLYHADGTELNAREYKKHRPRDAEIIVMYAGANHTTRYAAYFALRGGSIETFTENGKPSHIDSNISLVKSVYGNQKFLNNNIRTKKDTLSRCINVKQPITSLFVPSFTMKEMELVTSKNL